MSTCLPSLPHPHFWFLWQPQQKCHFCNVCVKLGCFLTGLQTLGLWAGPIVQIWLSSLAILSLSDIRCIHDRHSTYKYYMHCSYGIHTMQTYLQKQQPKVENWNHWPICKWVKKRSWQHLLIPDGHSQICEHCTLKAFSLKKSTELPRW